MHHLRRRTLKTVISHKTVLLLLAVTSVTAENAKGGKCDGDIFHHVYYDKIIVLQDFGKPNNLVMHKYSNILFFSHTVQNRRHMDFRIMACEISKKECFDVKGIPGGFAVAYDPSNDDIYFGGHDGIYRYNFLTKSAEFFAEEDKSIWGLFIRRNFYYIEYPTQKLFVYQDDRFVHVAEAMTIEIDHFYVSKRKDKFFSNKTALYKVGKDEKDALVLNDEIVVRQITEDNYGDIYFCASDGIYMEDHPYHRLKKVASIDEAYGLTFDENDHIIYSNIDTIYKLFPSNNSEMCYELYAFENKEENSARRLSLISKLSKLH